MILPYLRGILHDGCSACSLSPYHTKKALSSVLHSLSYIQATVSKYQEIPPETLLSGAVLLFAVLLVTRYYLSHSRQRDAVLEGRLVLEALLSVITPTRSTWPSQYSTSALAGSPSQKCLRVPLEVFYKDIVYGVTELRDPIVHLPSLFHDKLTSVSGLSVSVFAGLSLWLKLTGWIISCELLSYEAKTATCDTLSQPLASLESEERLSSAPPSSLFLGTLDDVASVSLDCVPHHHLESHIRKLQASLIPGASIILGLTTRSVSARRSFWSATTIFTAIPFLPRLSATRGQKPRTTTPLFASVPAILRLVTSGPTPLTVEIVRNVSREYADFLRRCAMELEDDPEIRRTFVAKWGRTSWNEERLNLVWEAALVDAGLLEGWAIVVSRPA